MMRILTIAALAVAWGTLLAQADERAPARAESADLLPVAFQQSCVKCHGRGGKTEGDVNLTGFKQATDLLAQPELLRSLIDALDTGYMPPEDEPELAPEKRSAMIARLQDLLHEAVSARRDLPRTPLRRMNRFQYNNAVQDLLQLNVVVFPLPERMLREHGDYFQPQTGKMPPKLKAGSRPLGKSQLIERRLGGVNPFPQDLRAEHGFDTQGDHLSLSPLLLESFLHLSRSIVESEDLTPRTCGIWPEFFAPPNSKNATQAETEAAVRARLQAFLTRAFRRPIEAETLERYVGHVMSQIGDGTSFTDSMKSAVAAALASPRFFYLFDQSASEFDDFNLASRLSFFLWGSIPDDELLNLAASGKLHQPEVLTGQVERMLQDRRLKRFCDSFPAQWLQLERIISSTPDAKLYPQFYFSKYRASMHMMLEPLLVFEAVLIENQSILKFIDCDFSYRSNLLEAWYRNGSQGNPGGPVTVEFQRVPVKDRRQGGMITNAAVMTMTSGATRTQPITRGAWVASVILNDPPEPPPADVPPLAEKPAAEEENLTLRERFAAHRKRADCAACHQRIDPLGFALENYGAAGIWRNKYGNGREVDPSGTLFNRHEFADIVQFKDALLAEKTRFARAFASHLLAFGLGREVTVEDSLALDQIVSAAEQDNFRLQSLIKQIVLSEPFRQTPTTETAAK